jgi:hypothetical protein
MLSYILNPNFGELEEILPRISHIFANKGTTIYKIRNEIKVIEINGLKLCVKSFGQPSIINRFAYAFVRQSKAKRSYNNAFKLRAMGIATPEPICWIEERNQRGFITRSYYLSLYEEHAFTLAKVFNHDLPQKETIIKDFAYFACHMLHKQGVRHLDLGQGNVLVKKTDHGFSFSLVDINRIRFNSHKTRRNGFSNLRRLGGTPIEMSMLASYYAEAKHLNPDWGIIQLSFYKLRFQKLRSFRKMMTAPLKNRAFAR